jgi:hypothetical protein
MSLAERNGSSTWITWGSQSRRTVATLRLFSPGGVRDRLLRIVSGAGSSFDAASTNFYNPSGSQDLALSRVGSFELRELAASIDRWRQLRPDRRSLVVYLGGIALTKSRRDRTGNEKLPICRYFARITNVRAARVLPVCCPKSRDRASIDNRNSLFAGTSRDGSGGTRTRDLRRDRPVQPQPPSRAVTGNYRPDRDFVPSSNPL